MAAYSGNATEAARAAGYRGNDSTLSVTGARLLRHPEVRAALDARTARSLAGEIATREERQALWTRVMRDVEADMKDRLRASELLGKSQADFVERVEHSAGPTLEGLLLAAARLRAAPAPLALSGGAQDVEGDSGSA